MPTGSPPHDGRPRLVVAGMGNVLRSDDGIGVRVIQKLSESPLPPGVTTVDVGIRGHMLFDCIGDVSGILLIDAARMGSAPGSARAFGPESLLADASPRVLSVHSVGFNEILNLARLQGVRIPLRFVGVEPASTEYGLELSAVVEAGLDEILNVVSAEIAGLLEKLDSEEAPRA